MLPFALRFGLLVFSAPLLFAASPVGVYLDFAEPPSPKTVTAMKQEAASILDKVGLTIAWRLVSQNQGTEPFDRLVVVTFKGTCASESVLQPTREILVLGSTAVTDGRVLPYSEVRCDQVRHVLPEVEFSADRGQGDAALGRALARVLAHELYHVLMGTTRHSASGAARRLQSTDDLKSDEFSFETSDWKVH